MEDVSFPFKMPEKSKGGLYLGQETLERQQVASTCGLVLAQGPHCYDKEKFPEGPWCKKRRLGYLCKICR